ncbi:hypothetical protein PHYBLDRAFT_175461 [Phycomyces blakesleeanus NRRL 1555(-)]|uniref:Uncharacterized protein n=1 Tax=Phycomyces blakesleeanus (strain ATCC 8743b / DSM 1359 / FGSC 10004 / NBRC 33097 / NRRL 1555) TaxID=763407 RepID=A0A167JKB8_PHYB8|nr:hypothetical protein PHYBLDRAFT_175461 [Phycomyces blakesleeanus NRRL 1555(-)]OAD66167.1 hypothetical protein PHYBLDRAFT_175461 [Phycomyces blakesleeanus NRRL 1555(-)]|eukprot:XP_018284207.1 hypothetical protein PHYBLDRAFT_175461 [Phycomyces blakesleeanus NRRL 1555(-)]
MSDINTTLLNSIQKIEVDLAEIKQALRELQRQFSNQFAPAFSAEDLTTMQQSIIEQSSLERIAESVKRAQLTEYPDQLGKQVINTGGKFKGKNEAQKYNLLLQILHEQDWKARCKEVPQGQPLPPLVPLSDHDLTVKRLHLKTLGHTVKHDIIDKDYPAASKEWKNIPEKNREYYMMHLERLAKNGGLHIHQCKRMWCARSLLRESFKSDNQTHKRRMAEKNKTQRDISDSLLSSPDMSETGDVESPIMADVLSPPPTASVEPACKRSRRSVNAYFTEQVSILYKEIDHSVKAAKEKQEVVLELKAIEQKKESQSSTFLVHLIQMKLPYFSSAISCTSAFIQQCIDINQTLQYANQDLLTMQQYMTEDDGQTLFDAYQCSLQVFQSIKNKYEVHLYRSHTQE